MIEVKETTVFKFQVKMEDTEFNFSQQGEDEGGARGKLADKLEGVVEELRKFA